MTAFEFKRTASAIFVGAVLFFGCSSPTLTTDFTGSESVTVTTDTCVITKDTEVPDTVISLGATGYCVKMPLDFRMKEIRKDTEFIFTPVQDTSGCEGLTILFTAQPGVVPGKRPYQWKVVTVLNQQLTYREYTLFENECHLRTLSARADSINVNMKCMWPEGTVMDRLFGIGLTISKSDLSHK